MSQFIGNGDAVRFPCTPTQTQFLAFDAMGQGATALNYAFRYRVDGPLRLDIVQRAFDLLVARHETLRMRFVTVGGQWEQDVGVGAQGRVTMLDLSGLNAAAAESACARAGQAEAAKPFDLAAAPLVRLGLIKLGDERFQLLITAHATVIDGWSLSLLLAEFGEAIAAFHAGAEPRLSDVEIHYGDFALWQAATAESGAFTDDQRFWARELEGVRAFRLTPARAVPAVRTYSALTRGIWLSKETTDRARAQAQARGTTFYQSALAALAAMLYARTGEPEVVIGTQVSGRNEEDAETIVGPLINAVVLRLSVGSGARLSELVAHVAAKSANALTHQSLPFASMVAAVAPREAVLRNPIYAINFALQAAFIHDDNAAFKSYGPFAIHSMPSEAHKAIWELNFGLVERPEGWRMSCEADGDLFDAAFIDAALADWSKALAAIADMPEMTLGDVLPIAGGSMSAPSQEPVRMSKPLAAVTELSVSRQAPDHRVIIFNKRATGVPIMALNVTSLYHGLASADPSRPFYDIQLPDDEPPKRFTPRSIGDMTSDAVRMIRRARPHGPYVLLGYCVAGSLALEAARRLREEGEDVPLVVMVDTWAPGYREDLPVVQKMLRGALVRQHHAKLDLERVRRGELTYRQVMANMGIGAAVRRWLGLPAAAGADVAEAHPHEWYLQPIYFSYRYHRPEPYDGRVLILRAREVCEGRMFPRDFGWGSILKGPWEIADFPGQHHAAFSSPGVDTFGAEIRRVLVDVDEAQPAEGAFGFLRTSP